MHPYGPMIVHAVISGTFLVAVSGILLWQEMRLRGPSQRREGLAEQQHPKAA